MLWDSCYCFFQKQYLEYYLIGVLFSCKSTLWFGNLAIVEVEPIVEMANIIISNVTRRKVHSTSINLDFENYLYDDWRTKRKSLKYILNLGNV